MGNISKIKIQNVSHSIKDELAVHGDGIGNIIHLTKAEYDALISKDDNTIYIVKDIPEDPSFGGFSITKGPLYYTSSGYAISDLWNQSSWSSTYGTNNNSTYFTFQQLSVLFESSSYSSSDMHIDNLLDPFNGWRLPSTAEWTKIITTDSIVRPGSTVNGSTNKHFALVKLTGITICSSSTPNGLLIFPDGKTITGKVLSGMDNTTQTTGVTESELNVYLSAGCIFLPTTGEYQTGMSWQSNISGYFWSSDGTDRTQAKGLWFNDTKYNVSYPNLSRSTYYQARLIKKLEDVYGLYIGENFICNSTNRYTDSEIDNFINSCEQSINKVTSISSSSTNAQYPSAKCVYDIIGDVESLINAL